ncbi:hypothetical protein QBC44DRAFT_398461 [Cladorrhinum sp. PSN332]|nr:hypothetical protein QBC44DRAFT_398461 [Cladorrhinum sp. PSN332]
MNTHSARRYACDRCREQKLKCSRTHSDNGSCDRCLRMGAVCVTSSGRPLGRPPINSNHRAQGSDDSLRSSRSNSESTFWLETSNFSAALPAAQNHATPSAGAQEDVFGYYLGDSLPDLDLGNFNDVMTGQNNMKIQISTAITSKAGEGTTPTVDTLGSISRQLAELKDQSWESWSPHLNHGQEMEATENQDLNGWNRVLNLTMRYATVLQIVAPSPPELSLSLMLLSTHIQLTELLEVVFTRLRDCLHEAPVSASVSPTTVSETPYMAHTRNIQIMMMAQVFECQMQTVERLMGLPLQYRIWSHRENNSDAASACGGGGLNGTGILSRENMSELVRAVMNQALDTIQSIRQISDAIKRSSWG